MIAFPPCKINLGLNVIRKRSDGYHDIETCFCPVPWTDILEVIPGDQFSFSQTGIQIAGDPPDNLCVKAYQLLKNDFDFPPVSIHLHKIIPAGAGLGGGSSDAAHTLRLLNSIFSLDITTVGLQEYAAKLGSDCAFFITDECMLGTSRGEVLSPVTVHDLKGKFLGIVKPDIHVSTAEAYAGIVPNVPSLNIRDILSIPVREWRNNLRNDFESSVFERYPELKSVKEQLYNRGALYASMSGSGSSVFGIFDNPVSLANIFPDTVCWSGFLFP